MLVGAGVTGVTIARFANGIASELEGRKASEMPDLFSGDLIDGNAGVNVGTGRFLDPDTSEKSAIRPSMVPCSIGTGRGVDVVELAEDLDSFPDLLEGLHGAAELEILSFALGPPAFLVGSIGEVNESHAQGSAGG